MLQLSEGTVAGDDAIETLVDYGLLPPQVEASPPLRASHELERSVLGWFVGNCTHCHNGSGVDGSSFDLRPDVALENTINQMTQSSAAGDGVRIVPGDPEASELFVVVARMDLSPEQKPMPPVGVDRLDETGIERLRTLIEQYEVGN